MKLDTVKVPEEFEPTFRKAQEYVSKYFKEREEDPSKGLIEVFGERYILIRAASMSVDFFDTVNNLYRDAGEEEAINVAKSFLFDVAHAIGRADARNFHEKTNLSDPIEKLSAGPVHFSHSGWAFVDISPESKLSPDENFYLLYDHLYSFEAYSWKKSKRSSDFPVCVMNAGYSSGWCEESFGIPLVTVEILCKAKGDDVCRFIMAHPSKIDEYIAEYLEKEPELAKKITKYQIPEFFRRKQIEDERSCAEEALRSSETKFRTIIERSPIGMVIIDSDRKIRDMNDAAATMIGISKEDIFGKTCHEFICPQARNDCPIYDHGQTLDRKETVLLSKDRGEVPIEKTTTQIVINGETMLLEMFSDITERKHAENLIRAQRDLALALNSATSMDDTLRLCIDAAIEISGMDCGGVYLVDEDSGSLDLTLHRGFPDDFTERASHYDADSDIARMVMAGKAIYSQHQELGVHADGVHSHECMRAIAIIPVHHKGSVIACLNIVSRTLHEVPVFARNALEMIAAQIGSAIARVKADDALRKERDRVKQYLDVAGVMLIVIDSDRRVRRINRKGCEILGCSEDEITDRDWFDNFIPERFRDEATRVFESLVAGEAEPVEYHETPVLTNSDEERIIAWHNTVLRDENGTITSVISSGEDVTERKILEQKLQQAFDRLKASYEELSIPVIQAWDGVLVLPIIGVLDSERINRLMDAMLHRIVDTRSKIVIIDITGVHSIDSDVLNHLLRTVAAARLLGAECVITGISPAVAQASVRLDIEGSGLITRGSLQEGLRYGLRKLGCGITTEGDK